MKSKTLIYILITLLLAGGGFALWQNGYIGNRQESNDVKQEENQSNGGQTDPQKDNDQEKPQDKPSDDNPFKTPLDQIPEEQKTDDRGGGVYY